MCEGASPRHCQPPGRTLIFRDKTATTGNGDFRDTLIIYY